MSYYRNNRMPEYAAYGGVPSDEAYGRANGGVPYEEAYGKKKDVNNERENRPTLREQLEANLQKIKEREEENAADDDAIGTQYAENTYTTTATDADYTSDSDSISDEDLYAKMWDNIEQFERVIPYPYIDTTGNITIGAGANVNNWDDFRQLNLTVNGIPATEAQKLEAYSYLHRLSNQQDAGGNYVNRNTQADAFENKTNVRISDAEARNLAQTHMIEDLAHLRREFADFDSFPLPLKEVLLDIQYNVAGGVNRYNWPKLYKAIEDHDIDKIIEHIHRRDIANERNDWAQQTAASIVF
ncbi:MAG: hypothetical protein IJ525_04315 [Alphaproteobacteria bacterium]|nr:hypothetical protein [Alphaproteobacteria bacterium]